MENVNVFIILKMYFIKTHMLLFIDIIFLYDENKLCTIIKDFFDNNINK